MSIRLIHTRSNPYGKMKKKVSDAIAKLPAGEHITMQGACHSYSDIYQGKNPLNLREFNSFSLDLKAKTATFAPGTRFTDILPHLAKHKLALPGHGDYTGQT